jgi:hypothetical protein
MSPRKGGTDIISPRNNAASPRKGEKSVLSPRQRASKIPARQVVEENVYTELPSAPAQRQHSVFPPLVHGQGMLKGIVFVLFFVFVCLFVCFFFIVYCELWSQIPFIEDFRVLAIRCVTCMQISVFFFSFFLCVNALQVRRPPSQHSPYAQSVQCTAPAHQVTHSLPSPAAPLAACLQNG